MIAQISVVVAAVAVAVNASMLVSHLCPDTEAQLGEVFALLRANWVEVNAAWLGLAVIGYLVRWLSTPSAPLVEVHVETLEGDGRVDKKQPLVDDEDDGIIQCWNPATSEHLGDCPITPPEDVPGIIEAARDAQREWAKTSWEERRRVLRMMNKTILANRDEICKYSCLDTGKTKLEALMGEVMVTCTKIEWICKYGEEALAPESRPVPLVMSHKTAQVEYHPLGVLGVIAPWNYPFHNLFNHIISGIFAGNAVVNKVSEFSAWSGHASIQLARQVLEAAGHNPDLIQLVQGFAPTGAALVNGGVDKVIFTGSPGVGKHVMRGAADTLTPVVLELGGKDPFIVTDGADVDQVVQVALRGAYQNCGQNCVGAERFYVYDSVHDEFVDKVTAVVRKIRQGAPVCEDGSWADVDTGATTTPAQIKHVKRLVNAAVKAGAKAAVGGKVNKKAGNGLFFEPTVLVGVTHDMEIANEEVFGPVMTIIRVPDDSDDACIDMVNSTEYGLGSSVFCKNVGRANEIAKRIYSGMTNVNDFSVNYLIQSLPFGGVKASGFNRFAGIEGLRECCHMKSMVSDRFGLLGIRTAIPPQLAYPNDGPKTTDFANGLIDFQYAPTTWGRIKGMFKLM